MSAIFGANCQVIDGLDLDANFKGLDTLPIISPPEALEHISSSQPLRLKLNGRVKFSGIMEQKGDKSKFGGDLSLDNLRVNQLKLSRNLAGAMLFFTKHPAKSNVIHVSKRNTATLGTKRDWKICKLRLLSSQ